MEEKGRQVVERMTGKIAIRCTPGLKEAVTQEARRRHLTPAGLVRFALASLVSEEKSYDPLSDLMEVVKEREGRRR